jgi:hypothetical protein
MNDPITVMADTDNGGGGGDPTTATYQQDSATGLLVVEAEHFAENLPQGSHEWIPVSDPSGYSGDGAVLASPNDGARNEIDAIDNSPRLDFRKLCRERHLRCMPSGPQ